MMMTRRQMIAALSAVPPLATYGRLFAAQSAASSPGGDRTATVRHPTLASPTATTFAAFRIFWMSLPRMPMRPATRRSPR